MNELNENKKDKSQEECEDEEDNDATNSKGNSIRPDTKGHNMNDLKAIDLNSADDVRQTMKALFTNKIDNNFKEETEDSRDLKNYKYRDIAINIQPESVTKNIGTDDLKLLQDKIQLQGMKSLKLPAPEKHAKRTQKKRPGRPPNAGSSKILKKQDVSNLYIGKLSNIVFSRRHGSGSDSDIDYFVF